jgi:Flp pilus assembly protein TadD
MAKARKRRAKERRAGRQSADEAWRALEEGNAARAEGIIRRAISSHSGDPSLWCDLGLVLRNTDRPKQAERAFETALLLDPGNADAAMNLALLHESRGFYRQALRIVEALALRGGPHAAYLVEKAAEYRRAVDLLDRETIRGESHDTTEPEAPAGEATP